MPTTLEQIAIRIIKEQELIIGPLAWTQATKVRGIHITDQNKGALTMDQVSNTSAIIDKLVGQYERLFGRASREVSKEAAAPFLSSLSPADIPLSLK